jgi:hypothetical protein
MIALGLYIYFFQKESWMNYIKAKELELREKEAKRLAKKQIQPSE